MDAANTQVPAHRFRTQLATIVSSVELLLHDGAGYADAEREELVREIGRAAQRMRDMLDAGARREHGHA